jgi:hypothetical protein
VFQDLDATLAMMLNDGSAPTELRNADVSFETPERAYAPAQATVNLFLHRVQEDLQLRDPVPITELQGVRFVRRLPPARVTCTYMVTAWSHQTGAAKVAEEHRLLGQALIWLKRFPAIPPQYVLGDLAGQPFPLPTLVAQQDGVDRSAEFWTALGISPRPSFSLQVTIAMDLGEQVEGPLVTTRITRFSIEEGAAPEAQAQVGGRVFDLAGAGIADALVQVVDAGLQTRTDTAGRYTFPRVPPGTRTVRVAAVGFQLKEQSVVVPSPPEGYEISLTPAP